MAEVFVELGAVSINHLVDRFWERGYDKCTHLFRPSTSIPKPPATGEQDNTAPTTRSTAWRPQENRPSSSRGRRGCRHSARRREDAHTSSTTSDGHTESSDSYRSEPRHPPSTTHAPTPLSNPPFKPRQRPSRMSYYNGNLNSGSQQQRANSAQPPRTKYYDDDEEYGSDYDDRTGRRYGATGRGYDDRYDDNGDNYREVIETERYKGPARDFDARRQSFRSNDPNAGAVTQYQRRSTQDDDYDSSTRRSRSRGASRGRRNSERERDRSGSRSRSRSYSRSRSRSRSGGERSLQKRVGEHFDTSLQGIGVGIAGAVVGGMAGRHFGERNPRHKNRDILIGALVGGLGANAAETKWKDYLDDKKEKVRDDEERWEQRWDNRDYGRSRSAMR